jgi:hypothetical protein
MKEVKNLKSTEPSQISAKYLDIDIKNPEKAWP